MSQPAEAWFVERYRDGVIHKYKNGGFLLKSTIMPPARVDGKKLYFPRALPGKASKIDEQGKAKTMNSGRDLVEVSTEGWEAPEKIKTRNINKMTASEMEAAKTDAARALGQAHDSVIMSKVHAGAGGYGSIVGAYNANWSLEKSLQARTLLKRKIENAPADIFCVLPIYAFTLMETYAQFSRSDYSGGYALAEGVKAKTWGGVHWLEGYDAMFQGDGANGLSFYMWARAAIGSGDLSMAPETTAMENGIATSINYLPEERAYFVDNTIDVGATVLLSEAIVECKCLNDPAATITLPANP